MKRTVLFLLAFLPSMLSSAQFSFDHCKDHDELAEREMLSNMGVHAFRANPLTENYDVKYHRMNWDIDPAVLFISGSITTYFIPVVTGFTDINFDLSNSLAVDSVVHSSGQLSFSQTASNLNISFPSTIPQGSLDSVTVFYKGVPSGSGFGSFANGTHAGVPVLWTLSEPYGAMEWWPCKQSLNDKADSIDVIVTTDTAYKVGTQGLLIHTTTSGSQVTYHWKHRYPIPAYLVSLAITNYAEYYDKVPVPGADTIQVLNYVYPENLAAAQSLTSNIIPIMDLFNNLFELYPFASEKYGHAQFGWGGGMEHQTMSSMGSFSWGLQAHEVAHQWFGDKITCGSWEDIWLNEGFATYLTGLTAEHLGTPADWNGWKAGTIGSITSQPDGSVWVDDTTSVSRIFSGRLSYSKGAYLLHMLRWIMGDADFYQANQNYLSDPNLAFGYAKTPQLQAHYEAQSGLDLDEFFDDWFFGEGYPSYTVTIDMTHLGTDSVTIDQSTSHPSVSFFEMPVPIRFVGSSGQDSIIVFDHTFSGQTFPLDLNFDPQFAFFDPDRWLISKNNSINWVISGLRDIDAGLQRLYPNPTSNSINLDMDRSAEYHLIDKLGKVRESGNVLKGTNTINMETLESGIYIISISTNSGTIQKKITKK